MAINSNKSTDKVVQERKLYTGLCPMKIIAINPTKAQLSKLGIEFRNDPVYLIEDDAKQIKLRLDFYVANTELQLITKVSLWIENKLRIAKSGAFQWINAQAQNCFAEEADAYKWFQHETARKAYVGEVDLHNLLKAWGNVAPSDECKLETMDAILEGNIKELKTLVQDLKDNEVVLLLGVKVTNKGNYQGVYSKFFGRASTESIKAWKTQLSGEYAEFKDHTWQNDLMLKPFADSTSMTLTVPDKETDDMTEPNLDDVF